MVHNPKHKVHSFRGLLGDGGQDEINLERQNVNLAYRIVKFEVMGSQPGSLNYEAILQVWREIQTSISATIDFSNPDLLAAAIWTGSTNAEVYSSAMNVIFDNILFSRNIYVTNQDLQNQAVNYYIEIEEVPVGAATLMQIKLGTARKLIGGSMGK